MLATSQIFQIVLCFLLIILTLIQSKGSGLFSAVGSNISFYRSRRGVEKGIFILTIVLSVLLVGNSLLLVLLS